jgi:GTP-sensing pleiotropic transcriptional regulator CodY
LAEKTKAETSRDRLHRWIDELPESELESTLTSVEILASRSEEPALTAMRRALQTLEPEELSATDREALREAYEELEAGETLLSHEEVRRRWLEKA